MELSFFELYKQWFLLTPSSGFFWLQAYSPPLEFYEQFPSLPSRRNLEIWNSVFRSGVVSWRACPWLARQEKLGQSGQPSSNICRTVIWRKMWSCEEKAWWEEVTRKFFVNFPSVCGFQRPLEFPEDVAGQSLPMSQGIGQVLTRSGGPSDMQGRL